MLWQQQLGHVGFDTMQKFAAERQIIWSNVPDGHIKFVACFEGKHRRTPFKRLNSRSQCPLQLLHMDLIGPMPIASLGGCNYILTITDDHSKFIWAFSLKSKEGYQVSKLLSELIPNIERQSGHKVKAIRSDNGTEFTNMYVQQVFTHLGVHNERTVPHSPQQNGLSERHNRIVGECLRTVIIESGLPPNLWAELLPGVIFAYNRTPSKRLEYCTPISNMSKLDYNNDGTKYLRRLGSVAQVQITAQNFSKFAPRSATMFLVGYSPLRSAWRFWSPQCNSIYESRDASFDEKRVYKDFVTDQSQNYNSANKLISAFSSFDTPYYSSLFSPEENCFKIAHLATPFNEYLQSISTHATAFSVSPAESDQRIITPVPNNFSQVLKHPDSELWMDTCKDEYKSLMDAGTWELVDCPKGITVVWSLGLPSQSR
jgi:transposase InsO family protein